MYRYSRKYFVLIISTVLSVVVLSACAPGLDDSRPLNRASKNSGSTPNNGEKKPDILATESTSGAIAAYQAGEGGYVLVPAIPDGSFSWDDAELRKITFSNGGFIVEGDDKNKKLTAPLIISDKTKYNGDVRGVALDPTEGLGMLFGFNHKYVMFFNSISGAVKAVQWFEPTPKEVKKISLNNEDAQVVGVLFHGATHKAVVAVADHFEVLHYGKEGAVETTALISGVAGTEYYPSSKGRGIEVNHNFGFHPELTLNNISYDLILSGGKYCGLAAEEKTCDSDGDGNKDGNGNVLELADANSALIYYPDEQTKLLLGEYSYIESIAVDTAYHVAILSPLNSYDKILVNLAKLQLDPVKKEFSLPRKAISIVSTVGYGFTNVAIETSTHRVVMAQGGGVGRYLLVGELSDPRLDAATQAEGQLGFKRITSAPVAMPSGKDDAGIGGDGSIAPQDVVWRGATAPRAISIVLAKQFKFGNNEKDEYTRVVDYTKPMAVWLATSGKHIALIDLDEVLNGQLALGDEYTPTPPGKAKHIVYLSLIH